MIIRTPFRVSFFGGGTDYSEYFSEYGGSVLSTTIDKYCYLSMRRLPPVFEYKNQLTDSKIERFNHPSEVEHPLVRAALQYIPTQRIQIAYDADLPACSGVGSSSSFAVGLLQGLHALRKEFPDRMTLAKEAIHLERELCAEAGGVQDQIAAAFGGFNRIDLSADGYTVKPVQISEDRAALLQSRLMLVFTGFTHFSGEISKEQKRNIPATLDRLHEMKSLVDSAERILISGDIDDFGRLLHYSWQCKQTLSNSISNEYIDNIYDVAIKNGALGGKILGAGGGGFMLLYADPEKQENIKKALGELRSIPFCFEYSGTTLLYEGGLT